MAQADNEIRATFKVKDTTDIRRFRRAVRRVYGGYAEDEDVAYLLSNTVSVTCGKAHPNEAEA